MTKSNALMKMPENAKLVSTAVNTVSHSGLADFRTISLCFSAGWILLTVDILGYSYFPSNSLLFGIPVLASIVGGVVGMFQVIAYFGDGVIDTLTSHVRKNKTTNLSLTDKWRMEHEGIKIKSWSKSAFMTNLHYLLPFRIFKKIKITESITYFPYKDVYVKKADYLTYGAMVRYTETFEGHRAVFEKAINSF